MTANATRQLAVNADDFGFTRDVNRGIIDAHLHGILTSTTLMANGEAFDDAVRRFRDTPTLDVGVHFVLVGGNSLLTGAPQPAGVTELLTQAPLRKPMFYEELKAQLTRILEAGIRPTHFDTHKHTHLFPPVLQALARLSQEYGIPWIRRPFDLPLTGAPSDVPLATRMVSRGFGMVRQRFHATLARHGCRTTDHFAGFQMTGRFTAQDLVHLIRNLPAGTTEFMCHPGYCTAELEAARTRLKQSREAELSALTDPAVRAGLQEAGVELCPYPKLLGERG